MKKRLSIRVRSGELTLIGNLAIHAKGPSTHYIRRRIPRILHFWLELLQKRFRWRLQTNIIVSLDWIGVRRMQRLNRTHRAKDRPTDVLSFPIHEWKSRATVPVFPEIDMGNVVICVNVARKQSKDYGTSFDDEMCRLLIHGLLHLAGFDHERSKRDEMTMRRIENILLKNS